MTRTATINLNIKNQVNSLIGRVFLTRLSLVRTLFSVKSKTVGERSDILDEANHLFQIMYCDLVWHGLINLLHLRLNSFSYLDIHFPTF